MEAFVRPDTHQQSLLYNKPTERMRDEIYGTSCRHSALAHITNSIGKALAIAAKAFGARILQVLSAESNNFRIVAKCDYSGVWKVFC